MIAMMMKKFTATMSEQPLLFEVKDETCLIAPNLYLGSLRSRREVKELGIEVVISFGYGPQCYEPIRSPGVKEYSFTTLDTIETLIMPIALDAADMIESAIKDGKKVLVHCTSGISVSVTAVIVYLIKARNMSAQDALQSV